MMERSIVIGCGSIPSTEHRTVPSPQLALLVVSHQGDGYSTVTLTQKKVIPKIPEVRPCWVSWWLLKVIFFTHSTMGFITIEE